MRAFLKLSFSAVFAISTLVGCTYPTRYQVSVNSFARNGEPSGHRYVLIPAQENVRETDLEFEEFAKYARAVLGQRGFVEVSSNDDAEICVLFSYGIGEGETHQYTYNIPVFGQTGIQSSTTYGTYNSYTGSFSATTYHTPSYGIVGSYSGVGSVTLYPRYFMLAALNLDVPQGHERTELWRTEVFSQGYSSDLRRVMPYMFLAARDYIATNTGKAIQVQLNEDDRRLKEIAPQSEKAGQSDK